jgi:hypothetical protein
MPAKTKDVTNGQQLWPLADILYGRDWLPASALIQPRRMRERPRVWLAHVTVLLRAVQKQASSVDADSLALPAGAGS